MTDIHSDKILILDFGAQYTQLIARRIREIGVYCEIWAWDHDPAEIAKFGAKGIILSGGPESTTDAGAPTRAAGSLRRGLPILGICYGMQTMAAQLGGATEAADAREFGHAEVELVAHDALLDGLERPRRRAAAARRVDEPRRPRRRRRRRASRSPRAPIASPSPRWPTRTSRWYGVQFHPEVTHTQQGQALLRRFVVDICGCQTLWTAANIIEDQIARVRAQVGRDEVILGLSGGVDSSVVAALLHGDRRPADLRVRRHRPAALERRRPGDGDVRRAHGRQGHPRRRGRPLLRRARRRRRPGSQAQDHRQPVRRDLRRGVVASSPTPSGWRRARSIPT